MLNFHSGSSTAVNTGRAIGEALERANASEPLGRCLIVLHSTMGHNHKQLLAAARAIQPDATIVGCTGSGIVGREGVSEKLRAVAALVVTGDEWAASHISGVVSVNSQEKAKTAALELTRKSSGINMICAFAPGLDISGDLVLRGIEGVFGPDVPIFGALAGDNGKLKHTFQYYNEEPMEDGLVLVGFADPELQLVQGIHHGSIAQEDIRFTVTKSEGNRIDELDGNPAWPAFVASLGLTDEANPVEVVAIGGLGIDLHGHEREEYDNDQILRFAMRVHPNRRSFFLQATCPEGTELVMVQRDEEYIFEGVKRLVDRFKKKIGNRKLEAVFQADCMARGRLAVDQVAKDEIIGMMQDPLMENGPVPWLGVYGFAEFGMLAGRNEFHNYTTTLSAVVRQSA